MQDQSIYRTYVLPDPLAPMIAVKDPYGIVKLMSFRIIDGSGVELFMVLSGCTSRLKAWKMLLVCLTLTYTFLVQIVTG